MPFLPFHLNLISVILSCLPWPFLRASMTMFIYIFYWYDNLLMISKLCEGEAVPVLFMTRFSEPRTQ